MNACNNFLLESSLGSMLKMKKALYLCHQNYIPEKDFQVFL